LIARKRKSRSGKVALDLEEERAPARGTNVIDLMAALKKSLDKPAAAAKKPAAKKPAASRRKSA
jgi:DNA end-binding protein Ku